MKRTSAQQYRLLILQLVLSALPFFSFGQDKNYITGIVLAEANEAPIPNASVFITNSSKGTITAANGTFDLKGIPAGKYDLVISSVGFSTQVYSFSSDKLPLKLKIYLQPKATELETVVVEPYEKNGWEKWGKFFLENFIGTTDASKLCKIRNYKTIHFRHSKKRNVLTAIADEPLIIENRELGYRIQYNLEEFSYDFENKALFFLGYTLFDDMAKGKKELPKRFLRERQKAYNGSIVHFMRSMYDGKLPENGFEVKRLQRIPNIERNRVRGLLQNRARPNNFPGNSDSSEYYDRILKQKEFEEIYSSYNLTADSLITITPDQQKVLFFDNFIYVLFRNAKEEPGFLQSNMEYRPVYFQRSVAYLSSGRPMTIEKNGTFTPVTEFFSSGYWAWSEKISHLLPTDYNEKTGR